MESESSNDQSAPAAPPAEASPVEKIRKLMSFIGGEFLDSTAVPERPGITLTVAHLKKAEVKRPGAKNCEEKWVLHFAEIPEFPMVLGAKVNRKIAMARLGESSRSWPGKTLTIYRDPDVRFGKDRVGGIRII